MKKRTKRITEIQLLSIMAVVIVVYISLVATDTVMAKSRAVSIIENNIYQKIDTTDILYFNQSELDSDRSLKVAVRTLEHNYKIIILDN